MELFSEIYSSYYRAVAEVLRQAQDRHLSGGEIQKILSDNTFAESALTIFPKLQTGSWPLLRKTEDGYRAACSPPALHPLSTLQQAWLKAVLTDPRIRLFFDDSELVKLQEALSGVEPLYRQEDFHFFDRALDSDDYNNPNYQQNFRTVLTVIRKKTALLIHYEGGKGKRVCGLFRPCKLEYSQKDDKFRAHCQRQIRKRKTLYTLNLSRIISAEPVDRISAESAERPVSPVSPEPPVSSVPTHANSIPPVTPSSRFRQVVIEITRERNALERCMVHFAHFEKRTEYDEMSGKYICTLRYNVMDETEIVIRVLSFGPTIRVVAPQEFVSEIRARVRKQSELISSEAKI